VKVRFLPEADQDIDRLYSFLAGRNSSAARKAMLAIDNAIDRLQESPHIGTVMRERTGDRQVFIPFGNSAYVLRYRLDEVLDTLIVVRVWHGRESRA
jgi:plasmid stabilization system protein ParE